MTAIATNADDVRREAARIAFALIRFETAAANETRRPTPSGVPKTSAVSYVFLPSWRQIASDEVEAFLVGLPSPALLIPTTIRSKIALMFLHELSGDRKRWAEKTLSNFVAGLDDVAGQLGLLPTSRILIEFDQESHVFSLAAVREWAQHLPVHVGWSIVPLQDDDRADACMKLMRSDGKRFPGRSCMIPPGWSNTDPDSGAG